PDQALATAIGKSPQTILGYINFYNRDELVGMHDSEIDERMESISSVAIDDLYDTVDQQMGDQIISMLQPSPGVEIEKLQITKTVAALTPLPILAKQAKAFAYFNAIPDEDGPIRKIRLLNKYQDKLFPALSLLSAAMALDADIRPLNGTLNPGTTIDGIALGPDQTVPTDLHGRFYINYYKAPEDYFPTFAISDIIDGTVPPEKYKGKVMLFGMTAKGLFDLRPTPFSPITPGVYIHAQAIQNILDDLFLERYYGIVIFEILFYLLLGLLMGLILPRIPLWASGIATFAMVIGLFWVDLNFIFSNGTWLLNVLPTLEILTIFMGTTLYGYFTEGREKRKVRQAFQFYMTKSVVDEMLKAPDKLQLGGERRVCTVLFSDIRGFTTISEALTPEELVSLLNSYLTPMTDLVFKYDGTLDKYMGDAIMAIFGAPVAHDDHPVRACYSALDMMASLKELQAMWQEQGLPIIDIGIGLNTGPMSVGNMGSEIRFDYTVMGDNVNLGSRLESINKQYGTNIIISEYTWAVVQDDVFAREIDSVRVKGKKEPVTIYELMGRGKAAGKDLMTITRFEEGIALYKGQKWDEATAVFEEVRKEHKENDFASAMYIDRCIAMKANPPGEAWDGVYTMTTK
ncbi:adenylate/guanylate cyclase domain-containing protein, partial [Myxococcota bacterium]|nr:adenylate/guanylate cyclase domain-containing protein [Myxococcota bacterium]